MVINERAEENELNAAISDAEPTAEQLRVLHKTIKAVTEDIKTLSFNTAIARMMEFVNFFTKESDRPRSVMEPFLLILSPFAPHLSEELWLRLGNDQTLAYEKWPAFDVSLITEQSIEIPVQLKGKVRARIQVPRGLTQADLETAARSDERVSQLLEGKQVRKVIVVPDRLVNFVVSD
jgi:leucyl-tRNA synthetase